MASDREIAQALGREKVNNSAFDAMGAFNKYYNQKQTASLALPLDFGKSLPPAARDSVIKSFDPVTRSAPNSNYYDPTKNQIVPTSANHRGFWQAVSETMTAGWNAAVQTVNFSNNLFDPNNPLYTGTMGLKNNAIESWAQASMMSPGQVGFKSISKILAAPVIAISALDKLQGKQDTPATNFLNNHLLAASPDLNIFDKAQREKAFTDQTFGKVGSWTTDVLARFTIDPTIVAGKAVKIYKVGAFTLKAGENLSGLLAAKIAGEKLTGHEARVVATFDDFIKRTDGMNEADLFRVKAIRESSNPAIIANFLSDANKIADETLRWQTKTDIIHMAQGNADAYQRLSQNSQLLAAKIGALKTEVDGAKFFGAGLDEFGTPTFDFLQSAPILEKANILITEHEAQLEKLYKGMALDSTLSPKAVPYIDTLSGFRNYMSNSQTFIDLRTGLAGGVVRFHSGFMYKRAKSWIDFTDNGSIQTVDNLLSRIVGVSAERAAKYTTAINGLEDKIATGKLNSVELKITEDKLKTLKDNLAKAHFTPDRKDALFAQYAKALGPDARSLAYQNIEKEVFQIISKQFGYSEEQIAKAYGTFSTARNKAHNYIKERSYSGGVDTTTGTKLGMKIVAIPGTEGLTHLMPMPLNESQLLREMATLDVDGMYKVLRRATRAESGMFGWDKAQNIYKTAIKGKLIVNDLTDSLDQMLKFEVLLRLGYPIRNVTEGSMRIMSTVGPLALAHAASVGLKNSVMNGFAKMGAEDVFNWAKNHELETESLILKSIRDSVDNPAEIDAQIAEIDSLLSGEMKAKHQYGVGTLNILGYTLQDAKGATPEQAKIINDKFITNASQVFEQTIKQSKDKIDNALQNSGDFVDIHGNDPLWVESYLRVVNRQIKNSQITSRILKGDSFDSIVTFLNVDPVGQRLAKVIGAARGGGDSVEEIVRINFENVQHLFPVETRTAFMKVAAKRNITAKDIEKFIGTSTDNRPVVNGAQITIANGTHPVARIYNNIMEKFYNNFGSIPENMMTKSPLFVDLYRSRIAASMDRAMQTTAGDTISSNYLQKMETEARQWARQEMRRNLYDLSEKTDAAHSMKYIFPFFGAFSDVMEKWGRIIIDDPSVLAKLSTIYQSPDRTGMTEVRNGITYINIPNSWVKHATFGLVDRPVAIPKASLNLIYQGGAWWNPGAGWFVQLAASDLMSKFPTLEQNQLMNEILPYGAQDRTPKDLLLQSAALRQLAALANPSDPIRANITATVLAEENAKFELGLRPSRPSKNEVNKRAKLQLALQVATRFVLPFATTVRSPYQYYIDEYRRLTTEDPKNGGIAYYNMYGDAMYNFAGTLSKNNTGIVASVSAWEASKKYSDLIAKAPEYGWFIIGDANTGVFNSTVYGNQKKQTVAPGSNIKFREQQDVFQSADQTQSDKGWILFKKGSALIEAQRIHAGFDSINSAGAEYLRQAKSQFIDSLAKENPAWGTSYTSIDTAKIIKFLRFAQGISNDPRISGRPDIKTLKEYMMGRQAIIDALATRSSHSIDSDTNVDLKIKWSTFTGTLLNQDITFNDIYSRILEKDDLSKGV